jgi:hypothetical protein
MTARQQLTWRIVGAAMVFILIGGISVLILRGTAGRPFEQQLWFDLDDPTKDSARLEMADRFIADGSLIGKTRNEIVSLLGEPPDYGYYRDWSLVYRLGKERAFLSIDSEWLVFRIESDDRVVDYRILHD